MGSLKDLFYALVPLNKPWREHWHHGLAFSWVSQDFFEEPALDSNNNENVYEDQTDDKAYFHCLDAGKERLCLLGHVNID